MNNTTEQATPAIESWHWGQSRMIRIKVCIFQNKTTKKYKWLSMESKSGESQRYLCESEADTADQPTQTPDVEPRAGNQNDYERDKARILDEGFVIVTEV